MARVYLSLYFPTHKREELKKKSEQEKGKNGKFGKTRIGHKRCCVFLFKMRLCMFVRQMETESERCGDINQNIYGHRGT